MDEKPLPSPCEVFRESGVDPEERIETLLMSLRLTGFLVAKEIVRLQGLKVGTMECPLCKGKLRFLMLDKYRMSAGCRRKNCISFVG